MQFFEVALGEHEVGDAENALTGHVHDHTDGHFRLLVEGEVEGVRASVGLTFHALRSNGRGEVVGVGEFVAGCHNEVGTVGLVMLTIGNRQRIEACGEFHHLVDLVVLEVGEAVPTGGNGEVTVLDSVEAGTGDHLAVLHFVLQFPVLQLVPATVLGVVHLHVGVAELVLGVGQIGSRHVGSALV